MASTPVLPQTPFNAKVQILPADTTSLKTLRAGGSSGTKIVSVIATSSDTSSRDVMLGTTNGGTFYPIVTVNIPVTAGQVNTVNPVNCLAIGTITGLPVDNDGQSYIFLTNSTDTLQIKALTTVTTAKEIDVTCIGADF